VLLSEPQRTAYDVNFAVFGIPVRVHPFFWLIGLLWGPRGGGPASLLAWIAAFFLGILVHELGHALVMRSQGGTPWITLYGLGGLASCPRMKPLRTANAESWRQIVVSAAGPFAGFALAAIVVAVVVALGHAVQYVVGMPYGLMVLDANQWEGSRLAEFANDVLFVTIVYGILNLLPIYPLDGGQIAREILLIVFGVEGIRQSLILSIVVAGGFAALSVVKFHAFLLALFFGYFAYESFVALQLYINRDPRR